MKVLIFGGKFNPIHKGHKAAIKEIVSKTNFDQVWIMPNGLPKEKKFISETTRKQIIEKFCIKNNFVLFDWEINQNKYIDTIDTIRYINNTYDHDFSFVIGADQCNKFHLWPKFEELSKEIKLIGVTRKGFPFSNKYNEKYFNSFIEIDAPEASSTCLRSGYLEVIDKEDLKLLSQDLGFWKQYLSQIMSKKRYIHSLNVADRAKQLALQYLPEKTEKAYLAGLLHDITKEFDENFQKSMVPIKFFENESSKTWHQWSGAQLIKEIGIQDEEIINAIARHTTTDFEMSTFDKIVFCADKTSVEREYKEVPEILNACNISLDKCFDHCFQAVITFLHKNNIQITDRTQKLIDKWSK